MNKKESNKVNSFNASIGVTVKNETFWTGSVNVKKQFGLIQYKIQLVSTYDQEQKISAKPSSAVKKDIKTKAIPHGRKAFQIGGSLCGR